MQYIPEDRLFVIWGIVIELTLPRASVNFNNASVHKLALLTEQEYHHISNFFGLSEPVQGNIGYKLIIGVTSSHVAGHRGGVDRSRRNSVDSDSFRPQLERHGFGEAYDAELGGTIL